MKMCMFADLMAVRSHQMGTHQHLAMLHLPKLDVDQLVNRAPMVTGALLMSLTGFTAKHRTKNGTMRHPVCTQDAESKGAKH